MNSDVQICATADFGRKEYQRWRQLLSCNLYLYLTTSVGIANGLQAVIRQESMLQISTFQKIC